MIKIDIEVTYFGQLQDEITKKTTASWLLY